MEPVTGPHRTGRMAGNRESGTIRPTPRHHYRLGLEDLRWGFWGFGVRVSEWPALKLRAKGLGVWGLRG